MNKKTFQRIALLTLPLAAVLAFVVGRFIAPRIAALSVEMSGILTLLGYVLGALVAVVIWAGALLPLRRRAGFTPIGEEFSQMREEGIGNSLRREREALEERAVSSDPAARAAYYKSMTLAGILVSGIGVLLTLALFSDGILMVLPLALVLVGFPLSIYYGVQYLRWSGR